MPIIIGALWKNARRVDSLSSKLAGDSVTLGHLAAQLFVALAQFRGALADAVLELLPGLIEKDIRLFARGDIRDAADVAGNPALLEARSALSPNPCDHAAGNAEPELEIAHFTMDGPLLSDATAIHGMHRGQPALPQGVSGGDTGHGTPFFVHVSDLLGGIHAENADRADAGQLAGARADFIEFGGAGRKRTFKIPVDSPGASLGATPACDDGCHNDERQGIRAPAQGPHARKREGANESDPSENEDESADRKRPALVLLI